MRKSRRSGRPSEVRSQQLPKGDATRAKNFCARCGALKLGHLCTSAAREENVNAYGMQHADLLTEQARRAIEEGALESDEEL